MTDKSENVYYDRLQRLFKIITSIKNKRKLNRKDLAKLCGGVSVKTISRDINTLRDMGYEIVFDNNSGYQFLSRDFTNVHKNLSSLEGLTLILSLRANKNLSDDFRYLLENKLLDSFSSPVREKLDELLDTSKLNRERSQPRASTENLHKLEAAVRETRKLQFDYIAGESDGDSKTHKVTPYALVWQRDRIYLIGDLIYRDYSPIHYRLDRMKKLRLLSEFGEVPENFALDEYLTETWRMFGGEKQFVRIKFEKPAKHVFENRLGPDLEENLEEKDTYFIFSGQIRGTEGLKTDLMALGDSAEVLEPPELREEIIERARNLFEKYRD